MISTLDLYRTTNTLVQQYGPEGALLMAAKRLEIANQDELKEAFRELGTRVGPRKGPGRRTKDDKEWYCLRLHLLTLAAANALSYPLTIEKAEPPDFLLSDPERGVYGIEVTEATEEDWQIELTKSERPVADDIPEVMSFDDADDGWVGEQQEITWSEVVFKSIEKKIKSISRSEYPVGRCDVLVYASSRACLGLDEAKAIERLRLIAPKITKRLGSTSRLAIVAVIARSCAVYDVAGKFRVLTVGR